MAAMREVMAGSGNRSCNLELFIMEVLTKHLTNCIQTLKSMVATICLFKNGFKSLNSYTFPWIVDCAWNNALESMNI